MNQTLVLTILGAGAMGAALTVPAWEAGTKVRLWFTPYDEVILQALEQGETHPRLGIKLPSEIKRFPPDRLADALDGADAVIIAVSSQGLPSVLKEVREVLGERTVPIGVITKGFEEWEGRIFTSGELTEHVMGAGSTVYLAGPSLAGEVARRRPTPVALASPSRESAMLLQKTLQTRWYRAAYLQDLRGASLSASLKNPYAILYGVVEGAEEAGSLALKNLKAGLLTGIVEEMAGIVDACGGSRETVYTLAGLGDVLVTVMGGRNSAFGRLIGSGMSVDEALEEMKRRGVGVVEGYVNTAEALRYLGERCPRALDGARLLNTVNSILKGELGAREVVESLVELFVG